MTDAHAIFSTNFFSADEIKILPAKNTFLLHKINFSPGKFYFSSAKFRRADGMANSRSKGQKRGGREILEKWLRGTRIQNLG